jgi:pimeloyl-ACP methyl ester carboxylesterase
MILYDFGSVLGTPNFRGDGMRSATTALMRWRRLPVTFVAGLVMLAGVCSLHGVGVAQTSGGTIPHFNYDSVEPHNVKHVSVKVRDGVTIEDITYEGSNGDSVPAYLVIPKGTGKFAGVIWGHWLMPGAANSNREEFLEEAIALARAGVISLLVSAPQSRPNFKPGPNPVLIAQQVVDVRRGLGLLLARPDIDAARVAYVGHSWDAAVGAILDATDKRIAGFVFMSGPQSMREYVLSSDSPRLVASRKTADMAKVEQSLKATAWADPVSYANKLGPAPAPFQYGLHDEDWVPLADAKDYFAMSSGPKTTEFYDADHALNEKARMDRDGFLRKTLKLVP